jgi:3-oxoacyl-[acyl-carrier-protein] synthase-3
MDTNDEWIVSRTGIRERRVCQGQENGLTLSQAASSQALAEAGLAPEELDAIIVATSTPDMLYPATACRLQQELGARNAVGFDLSAACSGFVFGLITASQFLRLGTHSRVLMVGVDVHSRYLDWQDRSVAILFGDGAGAIVLEACPEPENHLLAQQMKSDGSGGCDLYIPISGHTYPEGRQSLPVGTVQMNGRRIYQFAVRNLPESISGVLGSAGVSVQDVSFFLCHQANQRILDALAERLEVPPERLLSNIERYGNTSAASIPLVWSENRHLMEPGNLLCLSGFGAGLTWGSVLWRV